MYRGLGLSVALVLTCLPGALAQAASATATIAVSATVLSNCVVTASPLVFGNYTNAVLDATTTVVVICTNTTPFNLGLDAGQGIGATVTTRKMTNGSSVLNYTLTQDAAHTLPFGLTIGTNTLAQLGIGAPQTITIYGRIPASQPVTPGIYADVVTATVTY